MSRSQLKLSNKPAHGSIHSSPQAITSPSKLNAELSTHAPFSLAIDPVGAEIAQRVPSVKVESGNLSFDLNRLQNIAISIASRFRPASKSVFFTYAKSIMRLTDERLSRSRETLAGIYRYNDVHELMRVLDLSGTAGPFDEDISDDAALHRV